MGVFVTARQLRPLAELGSSRPCGALRAEAAELVPDARRSLWEWLRDKIIPDGGDGGCAAGAGEEG